MDRRWCCRFLQRSGSIPLLRRWQQREGLWPIRLYCFRLWSLNSCWSLIRIRNWSRNWCSCIDRKRWLTSSNGIRCWCSTLLGTSECSKSYEDSYWRWLKGECLWRRWRKNSQWKWESCWKMSYSTHHCLSEACDERVAPVWVYLA